MKKNSVFEILGAALGILPIICIIVCAFIDMDGRLYMWLGIYILLFGWYTIARYIRANMPDVEKPEASAACIHFFSVFMLGLVSRAKIISESNGDNPLLCFALIVLVFCGILALKYHSEKHAYYKMRYNELIKECNELRKEIENGRNA